MEQNDPHKKEVIMSEVMPPERSNFTGHIHGGYIALLMDRVAYACAARYCGKHVVTVSMDQVLFKKPIFVGELVTFHSMINYVGRSSMIVGIRVTAENLQTGEVRHTNTSYITMVAIDEDRKPCEVPKLVLNSAVEKRRFKEAELHKQLKAEFDSKFKTIKEKQGDK